MRLCVQAASTHPYWGQHMSELWVSVLAGVKERLDFDSYKTVCDVLIDTWNSGPVQETAEAVQFQLRLDHTCSAGACADGTCTLCVNSASRPCPQLFKSKYLLRDGIVPACGSGASVSVVRTGRSGTALTAGELQALPPFVFQVSLECRSGSYQPVQRHARRSRKSQLVTFGPSSSHLRLHS